MDTILSIVGLIIIVLIVWAVLKFVLRLAARTIGCVVTLLIAVGIVAILFLFVF